jgi:hypothetical protein
MNKVDCLRIVVALCAASVVLWSCAQVAQANFTYGTPTKVENVNSGFCDANAQISRDGLELYFTSFREHIEGQCYHEIWVSRRATAEDPWSEPVRLDAPVNGPGGEDSPSLSADGLELYFADTEPQVDPWPGCTPHPDGYGRTDLWVSKRASKDEPWGVPANLGPVVNSANAEYTPCISADGLELYFSSDSPGGVDNPMNCEIFVTKRATKDDPWGKPVNLGPNVNNEQYEFTPFISPDSLTLFFSRGYAHDHIYVCQRKTTSDLWGPAQFFAPVNSGTEPWFDSPGQSEFNVSFSSEDSTIYFARGTTLFATDFNIWQVKVTPIVDFNGDGTVDGLDLMTMGMHWGEDHPLCDIAPSPCGDGVVDVLDLLVLAKYMDPAS